MGITDGQAVNQTQSNAAWLPKGTEGGTALGIIALSDSTSPSGTAITNPQRELNAVWSWLGGIVNQVKTYLPTFTKNNGFVGATDTMFARVDAISGKFDATTGHVHSAAAGDAPAVSANNIAGVVLKGSLVRGTDLVAPSGSSTVVTTQLSGATESSGATVKGVVTTAPYNLITLRLATGASTGDEVISLAGDVVYGRLTKAGSVWTLSYYTDIAGVETAYTLTAAHTSAGLRWWYQQLYNPIVDAPVYDTAMFQPSDEATNDVNDADATNRGLVSAGTQTLGGKKTFNAGIDLNSQNITNVLNPVSAQDASTKNYTDTAVAGIGVFGKNRIINGDFRIDQRNAGVSANAASGVYFLDRWLTQTSNAGVVGVIQETTTLPAKHGYAIKLTVSTADAAVAAGDYLALEQKIEGLNVSDLDFGKATAQSVTISFWVRSSKTGTYCITLLNSAKNRSYVATYTVNSANTYEQKTITVAGDTSGTWLVTTGVGLILRFGLMAGSTFQQTAGSWSTGDVIGSSAQVNWLDTNGATFYLTGVQLEAGTVSTNFERRLMDETLESCQRYFQWLGTAAIGMFFTGYTDNNGDGKQTVTFLNEMRAVPTATVAQLTNINATVTVSSISTRHFKFNNGRAGAGMQESSSHVKFDAEL